MIFGLFRHRCLVKKLRLNDQNIGTFANYDGAYQKIQDEIRAGFTRKYRECDIFFGQSNIEGKKYLPSCLIGYKPNQLMTAGTIRLFGLHLHRES